LRPAGKGSDRHAEWQPRTRVLSSTNASSRIVVCGSGSKNERDARPCGSGLSEPVPSSPAVSAVHLS
jgi:hypothetical protein